MKWNFILGAGRFGDAHDKMTGEFHVPEISLSYGLRFCVEVRGNKAQFLTIGVTNKPKRKEVIRCSRVRHKALPISSQTVY